MQIHRFLLPIILASGAASLQAAAAEAANTAPIQVVVKPTEQPVRYHSSLQYVSAAESYPSLVFQDYHVPAGNQFRLKSVALLCHSYGNFGEPMATHLVVNGITVASFRVGTVIGRSVTSGDTVDILLSPGDAVHVVASRTGATQGICNTFLNGELHKL